MNLNEIMRDTIYETQYITKGRLKKFLKDYDYLNQEDSIEDTDIYSRASELITDNSQQIVQRLQEYEYDKNYKYFSLYKINCSDIEDKILMISEKINHEEIDIISEDIERPTIREYSEDIDFKFCLKLGDFDENRIIKYPIIATIFKDIGLVSIKFCSVSEEYYKDQFYIDINNKVKDWLNTNLELNLEVFDSMTVFKSLYNNIRSNSNEYANESIHSILMDDEMNGRSYFRASDKEMLPFLDELLNLVEKFESQEDKKKVLEYIKRYESEAIIRSMGITWKNIFSNSSGRKGSITVCISRVYSVNNPNNRLQYEFLLHHIYQGSGVNRERVNYVIRYISNYIS